MEMFVTVSIFIAIILLIVVIWYYIDRFIELKKRKKIEKERRHRQQLEDNILWDKKMVAQGTIERFIKNAEAMNPIVLDDGTSIHFHKGVNTEYGVAIPEFYFNYYIDGKSFTHSLNSRYRTGIGLRYKSFDPEYLKNYDWVINEVINVVLDKQKELDIKKRDEVMLKVQIAQHRKVKKVGE